MGLVFTLSKAVFMHLWPTFLKVFWGLCQLYVFLHIPIIFFPVIQKLLKNFSEIFSFFCCSIKSVALKMPWIIVLCVTDLPLIFQWGFQVIYFFFFWLQTQKTHQNQSINKYVYWRITFLMNRKLYRTTVPYFFYLVNYIY